MAAGGGATERLAHGLGDGEQGHGAARAADMPGGGRAAIGERECAGGGHTAVQVFDIYLDEM